MANQHRFERDRHSDREGRNEVDQLPDQLFSLASALLVVGSLLWFGWLEWPGLHWDADLFGSAVMNVALKDEWSFSSYSTFLISRATDRYDFHGILQIWLYAKLFRVHSWQQLTIAMAAINGVTYLAWAGLFQQALQRHGGRWTWFSGAWLAVVPAVICLGLQGRPEQVAPLLLAAPAACRQLGWTSSHRRICDGVTLGLLFLLSPLVGLLSCFGYLLWAMTHRRRALLSTGLELAPVLLLMLTVSFLGWELISPFSFWSWLQNLRTAGTPVPWSWVIPHQRAWQWGTTVVAPFWSVILLAALLIVLAQICRRRQLILLAVTVAMLTWALQRGLDYSYIPFLPVVMFLWIDEQLLVPTGVVFRRLCLRLLPHLFALVYVLMLLQQTAYSFVVWREGGTPAQARRMMASLEAPASTAERHTLATSIALARAGVVLAPMQTPSISLPWSTSAQQPPFPAWHLNQVEKRFNQRVQYFVLQQPHNVIYNPPPQTIYLDRDQPFVLIQDGWKRSFSFLERRLTPARLGNAFWLAVYKRANPLPQQQPGEKKGDERPGDNNSQPR